MTISDMLLIGFDDEMAATKKTLERVPFEKGDWKPHEKSMPIGRLAAHLATLPHFVKQILKEDSIDAQKDFKVAEIKSSEELIARFDELSRQAHDAIAHATDEHLLSSWILMAGDKKLFEVSRVQAIKIFMMHHMIHHRAQLGVYLRLNDLPVPAIYGPSADEKIM